MSLSLSDLTCEGRSPQPSGRHDTAGPKEKSLSREDSGVRREPLAASAAEYIVTAPPCAWSSGGSGWSYDAGWTRGSHFALSSKGYCLSVGIPSTVRERYFLGLRGLVNCKPGHTASGQAGFQNLLVASFP